MAAVVAAAAAEQEEAAAAIVVVVAVVVVVVVAAAAVVVDIVVDHVCHYDNTHKCLYFQHCVRNCIHRTKTFRPYKQHINRDRLHGLVLKPSPRLRETR